MRTGDRVLRQIVSFFLFFSVFLLPITACNRNQQGQIIEMDSATRLYLELEQKYKRQMHIDGYVLFYSLEKPKTVVIHLQYYPGSAQEEVALRVLEAAKKHSISLANNKYGIMDLLVRTEIVKLEKKEE